MSLIKYGIAAAVGYHLGQPQGRKQLEQLRRQVVQLGKRPKVKQWQERGGHIAYERALAAKSLASTTLARQKTGDPAPGATTSVVDSTDPIPGPGTGRFRRPAGGWRKPRPTPADRAAPLSALDDADGASAATGFGGRTVAEDSEAARTGVTPPPPVGRPAPPPPAGQP
jgi:hypothetical protein